MDVSSTEQMDWWSAQSARYECSQQAHWCEAGLLSSLAKWDKTMNEPSRLAQLIDQIAEAFRTYDQLAFDEEYKHKLGNPVYWSN